VDVAGLSLRRSVTIWSLTAVAYVTSFLAEGFLERAVSSVASVVVGIGLLVLGPIVVAWRFGRPPMLLLVTLTPVYYAVIALSVSDYDEPRWSYSRFWDGVVILGFQLIPAAITAAFRTMRRARRPSA
jgi:hypothetical protein